MLAGRGQPVDEAAASGPKSPMPCGPGSEVRCSSTPALRWWRSIMAAIPRRACGSAPAARRRASRVEVNTGTGASARSASGRPSPLESKASAQPASITNSAHEAGARIEEQAADGRIRLAGAARRPGRGRRCRASPARCISWPPGVSQRTARPCRIAGSGKPVGWRSSGSPGAARSRRSSAKALSSSASAQSSQPSGLSWQ
jgi:hypothetical protein